jgi:hypothetical protein
MLNAKVISARLSAPLRSACSSVFDRSARPDAFRLRLRPDEELRQKPEFSGHPAETEADDPVVAFRDPQLGRAICLAELRKRGRWRRRRRPPAVAEAQFVPRLEADALAFLQILGPCRTVADVHRSPPMPFCRSPRISYLLCAQAA